MGILDLETRIDGASQGDAARGMEGLAAARRRLADYMGLRASETKGGGGAGALARQGGIEMAPDTDSAAVMEAALFSSRRPAEAVRRVYEAFFPGVMPAMRRLQERAVDWQIDDLRAHGVELSDLPAGVEESPLFHDFPLPVRHGRKVTPEGLALLRIALLAHQQLQPRRTGQVVLELGSGLGELARLIHRLDPQGPPHTHVLVDVPEALAVAGLFLELEFPGQSMLWVDKSDALTGRNLADWRFIMVPVDLAASLAGRYFDLFVYAAPLAGPQSTGACAYGRFVQEIAQVDRLVALNRFLNTDRPNLMPWQPHEPADLLQYDARWQIENWELEPAYLRCPWMTRMYPRCVQLVARRNLALTPQVAAQRSRSLLEDVGDYVWVRHFDGDDLEHTSWDHALIHDGSMGGSIFKIWESLRLSPNLQSLILMLHQLDQLQRYEGKVVVETPVYESMIEQLLEACPDPPEQNQKVAARRWLMTRRQGRTDVANLQQYLREVLLRCRGKRIVCYGVGKDFDALIKQNVFAGQTIVGLIDDRWPAGTQVHGHKIVALAELPGLGPEVILATSSHFGAILRERAQGIAMALGLKLEIW